MAQSNAFFGRESELRSLVTCLDKEQIISIVGPFGAGKTRLSKALIKDIQGALFFDLSEAFDNDVAMRTIADGIKINLKHDGTNNNTALKRELDQVGRFLFSQKTPVVVIDNAEQILGFVREAVQRWSSTSPSTVFVITTREGLEVENERIFSLSGLDVDHAIALFIDRAERIEKNIGAEHSKALILKIVESLDRLPLLIELAASRVDLFSLRDLVDDLEGHLTKIRTRDKSRSERQATVIGAIDWSWNLLDANERKALGTMSLFGGSFSLVALEAISAQKDIAILLGRLLEKSLLKRDISKSDPNLNRFSLYESVRIYMLEKSKPDSDVFTTYWATQAALLCEKFPQTRPELDSLLRDDFENFLSAFETSQGMEKQNIAVVLDSFLEWRGPQGLRERILEESYSEAPSRNVRARLVLFYLRSGGLFLAESLIEKAQHLDDQFPAFMYAMISRSDETDAIFDSIVSHNLSPKTPREFELLALVFAAQGTRKQDEALLGKARKFALATKDDLTIAKVLNAEGALLTKKGHFSRSLKSYERAFNLLGESSPMRDTIAGNIGLIAHYNGNLDRAIEAYADVERSLERAGLSKEAAMFSANRAGVLIESNQLELAAEILDNSEFVLQQFESESLTSICISKANIAHLKGDLSEAQTLYESILVDPKLPSIGGISYLTLLLLEKNEFEKVKSYINNWEWKRFPVWDAAMQCLAKEVSVETPQFDLPFLPLFVSKSLDNFEANRPEKNGWIFTQLLRRTRNRGEKISAPIRVKKDGGGVEIDGRKIDLSRRGPAKKLLAFLVREHLRHPDITFDLDALFEAGWPGVTIDYESAHKRVYAAIGTLRRQGLESFIETTDEGYRIYTDLCVEFI